jgi:tetratricopeptide (TPR) repeat protein
MKRRLIRAITTLAFLFFALFALTIGTVQISAQQPTPTPGAPVPTPTPPPDLERRIWQLEAAQVQITNLLEVIYEQSRLIITGGGAIIAILVGIQGLATGIQLYREGRRDRSERTGIDRVSDVMSVIERTLESRLDAEETERERAIEAESRLQKVLEQVGSLERFHRSFQTIIKNSRLAIEERASRWAKEVSRHDFRGMTKDLNSFAQQFDTFKTEFEPLEEEPRTPFSVRVPYIRGIAAHYANQPGIAKQYLEEVVCFEKPEPGETPIAYSRRVANAYYYLGLTESNFGKHQNAIELFEKANELDLQDRDFLTRVVIAEAYVMMNNFDKARQFIGHVKKRLDQIENEEGFLHNFHRRLQSRAALIGANIEILERKHKANWREEAQRLLERVHDKDPHYYYATATLAQVYAGQGDSDKAQSLFGEAYTAIERLGHLLTVTETRSKILLLMVAGICCKHGPKDERRSDMHLDEANSLRRSLPKVDNQVCTVFSTLSKRNESSETISHHIELVREGKVLL